MTPMANRVDKPAMATIAATATAAASSMPHEQARLAALESYGILDTEPEPEFNDIVRIAAEICGVPMALISLLDDKRQWFKAALGISSTETPREVAFCDHAIRQDDVMIVEDATRDVRFSENPLVTGEPKLRFYAGAQLITPDGLALGTLCVLDDKARSLSQTQILALRALARQVITQLELRKALALQRTQEAHNRLILDSAVDYAIITIDLHGRVTSWNEGARRILGWTAAEMYGRRCDDFFTAEDRAAGVPEREMGSALTQGRGSDERWHLRKDGSRFFASGEMMPLKDAHQKPVGFLKILRDQTKRHLAARTQPALLELGDRLGRLQIADDMSSVAAEILGRTLHATAAGYGTIDADAALVTVERGWSASGTPGNGGRLSVSLQGGAYADALTGGQPVVIEDVRTDPRGDIPSLRDQGLRAMICTPLIEHDRLVALFFVVDAAPRGWDPAELAFLREVADRTRLAIERCRAESHYRDLAASLESQVEARLLERNRLWSSTSDLMGTAGFDGYLKEINPAWTRLLGWDEATLLSRPYIDVIETADHDGARRVIKSLAAGEPLQDYVNSLHAQDGSTRTVTWSAVPDGDVFYMVGRDITAQRDMEERLRQSQKMEAIGQLTGGIAHDFNNLLAGILGAVALIRVRFKSGRHDSIEQFIDAAERSAKSAASLTERLLAFSRRQSLDAKPCDVNRLIEGMQDLLRPTLGEAVNLHAVLQPGLWPAISDANQLENAILNLCINARDAMAGGGRLSIETANAHLDESYARRAEVAGGDYVAVSVADTGCGMPPEVVARAFDPFFTTKPIGQGTGLGLSMIYGFAKQSGGHVRIHSEVGRGTTITLYLPRATQDDPAERPAEDAAVPRGDGETVLIVEDDATVRMLIVEVLKELGYSYLEAPDPQTALKILDADFEIDLLLTDVGLPHMNGRQLAEIARQKRRGLKVLFLTGYAETAAARGGFLGPDMEMIGKPFALDALAAKVREMVGG
jgi:PAS domain S-box-containing protein